MTDQPLDLDALRRLAATKQEAWALERLAKAEKALRRIADIERGWGLPHRLEVARCLVQDCVIVAKHYFEDPQ